MSQVPREHVQAGLVRTRAAEGARRGPSSAAVSSLRVSLRRAESATHAGGSTNTVARAQRFAANRAQLADPACS